MFSLIPWRKKKAEPKLFYSPFKEMEDMVNRMFADFYGGLDIQRYEVPAFNMYREGDNLVVEASLPGFDKKNITVELDEDLLTIRGEHKEESKKEEKDYYYKEFSVESFSRTVRLPNKVNPEDLKAQYKDGVLKITIPAKDEEKKVKTIKIE